MRAGLIRALRVLATEAPPEAAIIQEVLTETADVLAQITGFVEEWKRDGHERMEDIAAALTETP